MLILLPASFKMKRNTHSFHFRRDDKREKRNKRAYEVFVKYFIHENIMKYSYFTFFTFIISVHTCISDFYDCCVPDGGRRLKDIRQYKVMVGIYEIFMLYVTNIQQA